MSQYKEILLTARPDGKPVGPHLFEVVEKDIPTPGEGEFLIKQTHMSMDPAMLGWMMPDEDSYIPPVALNTRMRSSGYGEVVASNHPDYQAGDKVMGMMGWTEYAISNGQGINKLTAAVDGETALAVFGLPGLTAVQGLFNVGKPQPGETLVVTGAAGSVGSMVGQLAKADGLRVIGVVGSDEKADWIVKELGFDGAINYKTDDLKSTLAALTPDGVDVFFENTGGPVQAHIFERMNVHGRVVVCGMIADYTASAPSPGPNWIPMIKKRLTVQGFAMPDHLADAPQLLAKLTPYVMNGNIQFRTHVLDGLESAMTALNLFFSGGNKGKLLIKL
ncbi:NADP-dependent oxidoreductase [Alteromonas gilva]|uniref:NADP-dependent oxidoreductase n=1 Tax=Alteromonas gilva TaxID=2987522 RepID=A0ABT5KYE0_9ALTE|nr:NADP-dependent oxidoreductase [Alteromonas gilva]MDC8829194.1 NADP-dependent oxidoreductase [Alteromonas gilva]